MADFQQLSRAAFISRRIAFSRTVAVLAGLFALAVALLVSGSQDMVPLTPGEAGGGYAVSTIIIIATIVLGLVIPAFGYRRLADYDPSLSEAERRAERMGGRLLFRIIVALGSGILLGAISVIAFLLLENLFKGATFTRFSVLLFSAAYGAALGFVLAFISVRLTTAFALVLGVAVLVLGVVAAMLLAANPQWWQRSISYLGHDETAETVFGIFLTIGGLILLTVILDMTRTLKVLVDAGEFRKRDYQLLHYTLPILAIAITMVGLFPTTVNPVSNFLHNLAANGMAVLFVILMLGVPVIIKIYNNTFRLISWAIAVFCIVLFVLHFGFHAINFVTLELLLLPVCGAWLIILRWYTLAYVRTKSGIVFSAPADANPLLEPLQNALYTFKNRAAAGAQRWVLASDDGRLYSVLEISGAGADVNDCVVVRVDDARIVLVKDDAVDSLVPILTLAGVPADRIASPASAV